MTKISQLPLDPTPTSDDLIVTVDASTTVTKRATVGGLASVLGNALHVSGVNTGDQAISLSGTTLSLTNGGSVTLPSGGPNFAGAAGTTFVIANSSSSAKAKASADYVCDGIADDVEINAAIVGATAAGAFATVRILKGTYNIASSVVVKAYMNLIGDGEDQTILVAANGLNSDVIVCDQFYSQTNHNYIGYDAAVKFMRIAYMGIQGNSAGQTFSGQTDPALMPGLVKLYGYKIFADHLMLRDANEVSFYSEFSNNQPTTFEQYETLPSIFSDIDIKGFNKYGFVDRGPHDSYRDRIFASASQYTTPIASILIQSSGNYSVAGNHYNDCYGNGPSTQANILIQGYPSVTGNMYAEGSPTTAYDIQTQAAKLHMQAGYTPIGIIFRGDSTGSLNRNHFTMQLIYTEPPLAYKLLNNMQANSFHSYNQNPSTTSYPAPTTNGGNTVLFDTTNYTGGNNEFYGRVNTSTLFSDETKLTNSDRVDMQSDAYPDYNRRSYWAFPMGGEQFRMTNDGIENGFKMKPATVRTESDWIEYDGTGLYMTNHAGLKVRLNKGNGDILVASSTAPDAWKAQADYVCTGTADDLVINPLIQTAYVGDTGGKILLSPGTFFLASPLALYLSTTVTTPTVKLIGSGMDATYLRPTAGVHAITIGKASQAWVQDLAFELDGSSDGIHDIDGLITTDGIGWRMRHNRIENIKWSSTTSHTGWGMQIQPFRTIFSNLDGNSGRGSYTYPGNGIRLYAKSTPNTSQTFNAGDSVMQKVQITVNGLIAGQRALWIDTDDVATGDGSYFNQMVFQWIGTRSNVTGQGVGLQLGHSGSTKIRSIWFQGVDFEQFGTCFNLFNAQDIHWKGFYTSTVGAGGIFIQTDNTGSVNNTVDNDFHFGTIGVFGVTANVIQDLNSDPNNPNTYHGGIVETVSGGSANINGSSSSTVPAGVLIKNIGGIQRGGTRHAAFNEPLLPIAQLSAASSTSGYVLTSNGTGAAPTWQAVTSGTPADASTSAKGVVQLTNDFSGTATAPTVVSTHLSSALPINQGGTGSTTQNFTDLTNAQTIGGVKTFSSSPIVPTPTTSTQVASKGYVDTVGAPATTSTLGVVQLAGDLAGTATSPSVTKINGVSISGTPASGNSITASSSTAAAWQRSAAWTPGDHGLITWSDNVAVINAVQIVPTAGQLNVIKLHVPVAATITNVCMAISTAGATLTAGQNFAALYNSAGTLLSSTADQATNWQTSGNKIMPLASAQSVTAGDYYLAFYANGTTLPTFRTGVNASSMANFNLSLANSRYATANTGLTTAMPGTLATLAITAVSWFGAFS